MMSLQVFNSFFGLKIIVVNVEGIFQEYLKVYEV